MLLFLLLSCSFVDFHFEIEERFCHMLISLCCFYLLLYIFFPGLGGADSGPGLKLPPLKLQDGKGLVVHISGGNGSRRNRRLEVENRACGSSFGPLAKVRVFSEGCNSGDVPEWEAVLGYAVCGSVANSQLVAIACEDATLHILYTDTGMTFVLILVLCLNWGYFLCMLSFT